MIHSSFRFGKPEPERANADGLQSDENEEHEEVVAAGAEIADEGIEEDAADGPGRTCEAMNGGDFGGRKAIGGDGVQIGGPDADAEGAEAH